MKRNHNQPATRLLNILASVLILATLFLLALTPGISMTEDLGRHLLLGKIILTEHHIPAVNLLAYPCPDFPFVNHHWLSEVFFYLAHTIAGLSGLILLKALLMAAALAIALGTASPKRLLPLYFLTATLCAVVMAYRAHIRPELFTCFGIALYGFLLTRIDAAATARRKNVWWVLLLLYGLLWANAHIYFVFGIGMVGAYLLACWIFYVAQRKAEPRRAPYTETILFLGLVLISCLNPNGLRGLLYPLNIFRNYGIGITENISPFGLWKTVLNPMLIALPFLAVITLYAIGASLIRRRDITPIRLTRLIIAVTSLIATFCMARSAPLLALTLPPLLGDILTAPSRKQTITRALPRALSMSGVLLLNAALIFAILNGAYSRLFPSPIGPTPFGLDNEERYMPLRRLQQQGLHGPVFNDYNIGSLVEYNLYPEPAYVDNRPEAFPASFWQNEYLPALTDLNAWKRLLAERRIQTIIVSITGVKEPFIRMMMYDPEWQLIHLDFFCAVWVRKYPENETILRNATYTYDDLYDYRDRIDEAIRTLDTQPFWKKQIVTDQIIYELYSLIGIDQQALAWPLLLQMHQMYPDYQVVHELMSACAPPDAQPLLFEVRQRAAQVPLAAKQVLDYVVACEQRSLTNEARRAAQRGRFFFPLNPALRRYLNETSNL